MLAAILAGSHSTGKEFQRIAKNDELSIKVQDTQTLSRKHGLGSPALRVAS